MLEVYLITLALAVGLGLMAVVLLLAASRTVHLEGFFHRGRGKAERPRWGGLAIFIAFALTPFIASAISEKAADLFEPRSGDFLLFLGACAFVFAITNGDLESEGSGRLRE